MATHAWLLGGDSQAAAAAILPFDRPRKRIRSSISSDLAGSDSFLLPDKRVKGYIRSLTASFCRLHKKGQSPPHGEVAGGPTGIDPIAPGVRDPRNLKLAKSQIAAVRPLYGKAPIDISA
jgi:hypothetical protein